MTVIEVTNLHKRYGDQVAVDDVSFTVEAGEIFGIVGPNGAGKTTTVEMHRGPAPGRQRHGPGAGARPARRPRPGYASCVGIQLQESQLPDRIKVWEALELYSSFYPEPADWRG